MYSLLRYSLSHRFVIAPAYVLINRFLHLRFISLQALASGTVKRVCIGRSWRSAFIVFCFSNKLRKNLPEIKHDKLDGKAYGGNVRPVEPIAVI